MPSRPTRRNLLNRSAGLLSVVALKASTGNASQHALLEPVDYYERLGVKKIINAAGTYTALTAAIMPPPVQSAVALAAKHPVRLLDLQAKSGEYLASRLHCEAALVSAGASSALTLGSAACLQVMNDAPREAIPVQVPSLKRNEVLIQKAHR